MDDIINDNKIECTSYIKTVQSVNKGRNAIKWWDFAFFDKLCIKYINTHILGIMHYNKDSSIFNQYDVTITLDALCITTLHNFLP